MEATLPVNAWSPFTYAVNWLPSFLSPIYCHVLSANIVVNVDWSADPAEFNLVVLFVTTNSSFPVETS